jgi:glycosylphosphatidylinositol deacylase
MRRRSSGSAAEDDGDESSPVSNTSSKTSISTGAGGVLISNLAEDHASQTSPPGENNNHSNNKNLSLQLDRRKSIDKRPSTSRSRRPSRSNWKPAEVRNGSIETETLLASTVIVLPPVDNPAADKMPGSRTHTRRSIFRSPWSMSLLTLATTAIAITSLFVIIHSFVSRQLDT